jgi:hypothetical protein
MLNQEIEKALQKIGQKTQQLENSIENIKSFVDKLNETQKSIENLRDEINKKDKILDERIEFFDQNVGIIIGEIDILQKALKDFIGYQFIRNEESDLSRAFILNLITPKDIEGIKNFIKYIEKFRYTIGKEYLKNGKLTTPLEEYLKFYFDNFINISAVVHPNEQYYKYLVSLIIEYHQAFLLRQEKALRDFLNGNENRGISIFDGYNLFNIYLNNLNINKNTTKEEKENIK